MTSVFAMKNEYVVVLVRGPCNMDVDTGIWIVHDYLGDCLPGLTAGRTVISNFKQKKIYKLKIVLKLDINYKDLKKKINFSFLVT